MWGFRLYKSPARNDETFGKFHERLSKRKGIKKATVAAAKIDKNKNVMAKINLDKRILVEGESPHGWVV